MTFTLDKSAKIQNAVYEDYDLNDIDEYDLIIIGGGAGGFSAATKASELGLKAVLINGGLPLGGTCVNVGCVPSKVLIEISNEYYYGNHSNYWSLKGKASSKLELRDVIAEKKELVDGLRQSNYVDVVNNLNGVKVLEGYAKFVSPNEVQVGERRLKGEKFIIATGARPKIIPFKGLEEIDFMTSRDILNLETLPAKLVVIGAGPIGLELAQAFFHFGSQVTILEKGDQILRETDFAVADELMYHLQNEGIKIQLGVDIKQLSRDGDMKVINMLINNEMVTIDANEILMATGVIPNSEKLGLAKAGVNVNPQGFILTNNNFQTSVSHIYAVGDVVGNAFLETIAAKEGYYAATNALEDENKSIDYSSIPRAVFTFPQVATVGISEEEYMEQYNYCECRTIEISTIPKAKALKETRGIIKMVIHPETDVIAGVQIVSPMAADLIHEATLAVKYKMTIDDIIDTVHVFPTMSEGIKRVAQAFRRDISIMSCCIN